MRDLFDLKIFVDVPADIRILRRTRRDIVERGRSLDGVISQYLNFVRPMHEEFVEPTKRYAHETIPWIDRDPMTIEHLVSLLPHHSDLKRQ